MSSNEGPEQEEECTDKLSNDGDEVVASVVREVEHIQPATISGAGYGRKTALGGSG